MAITGTGTARAIVAVQTLIIVTEATGTTGIAITIKCYSLEIRRCAGRSGVLGPEHVAIGKSLGPCRDL